MEDNNQESVVVDEGQQPEEHIESTQETETEPQGEVETEEKKGANQRIKELSQTVRSLNDRIAELTQPVEFKPFVPQVNPGEEITPERYSQDVTKTADSLVQLRMKQYEAESRIKSESDQVVRDYPQLNPKSKSFDPELSEAVTEAVESHIRANPYSASVKKFVDKQMKPYKQAVAREVGQATENIARQVTEAAVRPTSIRKQEKTASEMTTAELEKKLGIVYS